MNIKKHGGLVFGLSMLFIVAAVIIFIIWGIMLKNKPQGEILPEVYSVSGINDVFSGEIELRLDNDAAMAAIKSSLPENIKLKSLNVEFCADKTVHLSATINTHDISAIIKENGVFVNPILSGALEAVDYDVTVDSTFTVRALEGSPHFEVDRLQVSGIDVPTELLKSYLLPDYNALLAKPISDLGLYLSDIDVTEGAVTVRGRIAEQ